MSFSDNKEFWKKFIELYQSLPCLWDVKKQEYSNKHLRNEAVQTLIEKCKCVYPNADKEFVNKKIKSLRASFRRELRKVLTSKRTGASPDDIYEPSLWYYDLLLFTADCEIVRDGTSSMIHVPSNSEDEGDHTPVEDVPSPSAQSTSSTSSAIPRCKGRKTKAKMPQISLKKRKEDFLAIATSFLQNSDGKGDEVSVYGKNIDLQLKEMNAKQRIIAEKLISDVIFHGKLGNLTENSIVLAKPARNTDYPHVMTANYPYAVPHPPQYCYNYQYPAVNFTQSQSPIAQPKSSAHPELAPISLPPPPLHNDSASNVSPLCHARDYLSSGSQHNEQNNASETANFDLEEFLVLSSNKNAS